jgi:hypothetical protein
MELEVPSTFWKIVQIESKVPSKNKFLKGLELKVLFNTKNWTKLVFANVDWFFLVRTTFGFDFYILNNFGKSFGHGFELNSSNF